LNVIQSRLIVILRCTMHRKEFQFTSIDIIVLIESRYLIKLLVERSNVNVTLVRSIRVDSIHHMYIQEGFISVCSDNREGKRYLLFHDTIRSHTSTSRGSACASTTTKGASTTSSGHSSYHLYYYKTQKPINPKTP